MRSKRKFRLILFAVLALSGLIAEEVQAIVGRPATPMSVAGVARRTVRR